MRSGRSARIIDRTEWVKFLSKENWNSWILVGTKSIGTQSKKYNGAVISVCVPTWNT